MYIFLHFSVKFFSARLTNVLIIVFMKLVGACLSATQKIIASPEIARKYDIMIKCKNYLLLYYGLN